MSGENKRNKIEYLSQETTTDENDVPGRGKSQIRFGLNELSSVAAEAIRKSVILVDNMPVEEDVIDMSMKKSAHMLAKNLQAISRMDISVKAIEDELQHTETDQKAKHISAVSIATGSMKGEDFIKLKRRGTAYPAKRSSVFSLGLRRQTREDVETIKTRAPTLVSMDSIDTGTIETDIMQMDVPQLSLLSSTEISAFVSVLTECLEQLELLKYEIPAKVDERWDDTILNINDKYGVPDEPQIIFREEMGLLPVIPTMAMKLQRDRNFIYKVLQRTKDELLTDGKFEELESEVEDIAKLREDERNLEANRELWRNQVAQLRELIENEKRNNENEKKRMLTLAQQANAHVDTAIFLNGSRLGYTQRWEAARLEQQNLKLGLVEKNLLLELNKYERAQSIDQIISGEVCAFLEEDTKELEADITMWTNRYNEELVRRQQEIDELKEKVEEQKIELQEMYILRDKYQAFLDERNAEIERLKTEARERERMIKAVTIIQSAWRGYMVRHQLGQYKNLWQHLRKRKKLAMKNKRKAERNKKKLERS